MITSNCLLNDSSLVFLKCKELKFLQHRLNLAQYSRFDPESKMNTVHVIISDSIFNFTIGFLRDGVAHCFAVCEAVEKQ